MRLRLIGDTSINRPLPPSVRALLHDGADGPADLIIGNLEIPLTDRGWPADKVSVSRSAPGNSAVYAQLGVDVWSLATNHALDWGVPGLVQTMEVLRSDGVRFVGAGDDLTSALAPLTVTARSGAAVAVLNFCSTLPSGAAATTRRPGVAPLRIGQSFEFEAARMDEQPGSPPRMTTWPVEHDLAVAERLVRECADRHDLVVVCLHWGVAWPFLPPNQGPLADYQTPVAHRLIEAGARVIVGTHSHSLHPVEFHGDGVILYSLGNFLFHEEPALPPEERRITPSMRPILRTGPWHDGAVVDVVLTANRAESATFHPLVLDADGEPDRAAPADAERILRSVAEQSPGTHMEISAEKGVFRR